MYNKYVLIKRQIYLICKVFTFPSTNDWLQLAGGASPGDSPPTFAKNPHFPYDQFLITYYLLGHSGLWCHLPLLFSLQSPLWTRRSILGAPAIDLFVLQPLLYKVLQSGEASQGWGCFSHLCIPHLAVLCTWRHSDTWGMNESLWEIQQENKKSWERTSVTPRAYWQCHGWNDYTQRGNAIPEGR